MTSIALSGCARRIDFTPKELERVQSEVGTSPVRVYVSEKVITRYDTKVTGEGFGANRGTIEEATRQDVKVVETGKNTMGLILEIAELNGQPLLWVTFDSRCKVPECAYGFVQTEDKRFRLVTAPQLEDYQEPNVYRKCMNKRMSKGKLASLAEANEVYVLKKPNGKLLTVDLQVKKRVEERGQREREKQTGVGFE